MFKLNISGIVKSYNTIKRMAFKYYRSKNIDKMIGYVDIAANIASNFNWIFTDTEIEDLLRSTADEIIKIDNDNYLPNSKRIVFYDQIGTTACLGLQYLRGLMAADYEILYVFESANRKCSPRILQELNDYKKAHCIIVDSNIKGKVEALNDLYAKIITYRPQKAILHTPAEGAFGVILWNALSKIERYRIVPGDHHFFIGVSCTDYFFEFRKYGYTVATEKRNIPKEKILIQPYYPIVDNNDFFGFPKEADNKVIVFSAGSLYKTYGESDMFFVILKKLLQKHHQLVILFAGDGFDIRFKNFILKNGFQNRLILLGYRIDLNMCIANSDIYLATFPFTGALTTQNAAYHSKPILSFTTHEFCGNFLEDIIASPTSENLRRLTYTDFDEFIDYAEKLINDELFRLKEGMCNNELLTNSIEFNSKLLANLDQCKPIIDISKLSIDYEKHVQYYINIENNYIPVLKSFLLKRFRFFFLFLFPHLIVPAFFNSLFLKKISYNILK